MIFCIISSKKIVLDARSLEILRERCTYLYIDRVKFRNDKADEIILFDEIRSPHRYFLSYKSVTLEYDRVFLLKFL